MAGPVDPRLLKRARATKTYLVAGFAVGLATAMLVISQAWLLSRLIVGVFTTRTFPSTLLLMLLAVVFILRAGLAWANQVLARRCAASVKSTLRADIIAARLRSPQAAHSSDQVTLLTQGLDALDGYFAKYLPQLLLASSVPFLVVGVVLLTDWVSAIILILTLPLIPFFMALIGWTTKARMDKRWRVSQRLARHFADVIQGLPTLQAFGRAKAQRRGLAETEERHRRETMGTLVISFLSSLGLELIATLSVALVAVGIGLRVVHGEMDFTIGLFVLILAPEAYLPIRQVGVHYHDSADGVAAVDAALTHIDAANAAPTGTMLVPGDVVGVDFEAVSVTYPGADTPALTDLSFSIRPGQLMVLTGKSGGGKSTALHVLLGFLSPTTGSVRVNDANLADLDLDHWRHHLAWVGQSPGMVVGTVADNVRLGFPAASDDEVGAALTRAGAEQIAADRFVGDDGEGLSAGERRRVAVARALLRIDHGAQLLVLDEPTAGLDAEAEWDVLRSVRATGAMVLMVSHRPAVIAAADQVVNVA